MQFKLFGRNLAVRDGGKHAAKIASKIHVERRVEFAEFAIVYKRVLLRSVVGMRNRF